MQKLRKETVMAFSKYYYLPHFLVGTEEINEKSRAQ